MAYVKAITHMVFVLLFRLIVTKDPVIIQQVASGQYKETLCALKHQFLSLFS